MGAHPLKAVNNEANRKEREATLQGRKREKSQLEGISRSRLLNRMEEASKPFWAGERERSREI